MAVGLTKRRVISSWIGLPYSIKRQGLIDVFLSHAEDNELRPSEISNWLKNRKVDFNAELNSIVSQLKTLVQMGILSHRQVGYKESYYKLNKKLYEDLKVIHQKINSLMGEHNIKYSK